MGQASVAFRYSSNVMPCAAASRSRNAGMGVTGFLIYSPRFFLQALEGHAEWVKLTYERIGQDDRHFDVTRLGETAIKTREFGEWDMGFAFYGQLNRSGADDFDPTQWSEAEGMSVLRNACGANLPAASGTG